MGILDVFKFSKAETFVDMNELSTREKEISKNLALKSAALSKNANYVGRGLSKARFLVKGPNGDKFKDWLYLLNVRPNPNQTASIFLAEVGKGLITDGEILLVVKDGNLFIADSFTVEEKSLKGNRYRVGNIQGNTVDEIFESDDVIYLKNENDSLQQFSEQLWADYGELLGRLINRQKTANQIRFTLNLPKDRIRERAQEAADGGKNQKTPQQKFYERVIEKIKNDPVVAVPLQDASSYQEYSNRYSSKASFVEDIREMKNQYLDEIAEMIGLPPALLHGVVADNQKNYEQAVEVVFEPLIRKLIDGLHQAVFTEQEYAGGNYIKVVGLHKRDLFDVASSGDKLIAAGLANSDEIREEMGLGPLPNGMGQKYYITKNYQQLTEKGVVETDESAID